MQYNEVTETSNDSLLIAMAYAYMAIIQHEAGDFIGAQESAMAGIPLLDEQDTLHHYCITSLYNTLGRSNVGLKNYDAAISNFKKSLLFQTDETNRNTHRNNIGVALRNKGDYRAALEMFNSIEALPDEPMDVKARRITNTASVRWRVDSSYNPLPDLYAALDMRLREKDRDGATASYRHLSDYFQARNHDSALHYARKMYEYSLQTRDVDDQATALRKLTSLAPLPETKSLFTRYDFLNDSLRSAQNAARNQFAAIRYESEKSKAENIVLQEENAQKKLQILRQQILLFGSIILASIIIAVTILFNRKRRRQLELESKAAIRENELKISQKVHDTVANGLYRIMSEIEHRETIDKEPLLDKIEALYERSRDISYEPVDAVNNTAGRINAVLTSFATPATKVSVVGNQEGIWTDISSTTIKELEQVLQELMVNMKKHSGARNVVLHFTRSQDQLDLTYRDNGRGFGAGFKKANGLTSTENRINQIGGQIIFTDETASGAEIKITVPINQP